MDEWVLEEWGLRQSQASWAGPELGNKTCWDFDKQSSIHLELATYLIVAGYVMLILRFPAKTNTLPIT